MRKFCCNIHREVPRRGFERAVIFMRFFNDDDVCEACEREEETEARGKHYPLFLFEDPGTDFSELRPGDATVDREQVQRVAVLPRLFEQRDVWEEDENLARTGTQRAFFDNAGILCDRICMHPGASVIHTRTPPGFWYNGVNLYRTEQRRIEESVANSVFFTHP